MRRDGKVSALPHYAADKKERPDVDDDATSVAAEPELALLAVCSCRPFDHQVRHQIERCATASLDWELFLRWCRRQRVVSLVFDALSQVKSPSVPAAVFERLRAGSQQRAQTSLRQIAESLSLIRALGDAGIGALCIKGPTLSQLAFGSPSLRDSRDIDLLVAPPNFEAARLMLQAKGYRRIKPDLALPGLLLGSYRGLTHEFIYRAPSGSVVELKHRLHPTASLLALDVEDLLRRPRFVDVAGQHIPTLPDLELFLYLCTHGSRHAWFRLKWIADIAALVRNSPAQFLISVSEHATKLGLERTFREAILLSHALFLAPVPSALLAEARSDTHASRGATLAQRQLAVLGRNGDPLRDPFFSLRLDLAEYRIRSDWRYRGAVLRRHAFMHFYGAARGGVQMIRNLTQNRRPP
jgi:Uncharacterised nucleotidyltransferase